MAQLESKYTTPKAGRNLPAAIGVALMLFLPIAVGLIWIPWLFIITVGILLSIGVAEVSHALRLKNMQAETGIIVVGSALSVIGGYWVTSMPELGVSSMTFIVSCLGGTVLAAFVGRLFRGGSEGFLRDVAASSFLIAYLPLLGVFVALLMAPDNGPLRVATLILCVVASDTGAYATGVLFGKNKMAPSISPSKTWEGFAGAVAWSSGIGVVCAILMLGIDWWMGLILGAVVAAAATVGDLLESLIKRDAGIKDMSNILPGHGGVMDRLDSMLMAFPVGWFVLNIAMGP